MDFSRRLDLLRSYEYDRRGEGDHPPRVILPFRLLTSGASNSEPQLLQLDLDRGSPQSFANSP